MIRQLERGYRPGYSAVVGRIGRTLEALLQNDEGAAAEPRLVKTSAGTGRRVPD
jgi:hypothetical protein